MSRSISVLVPSLDNLECVKLLWKSFLKHSERPYDHEFLVYFNSYAVEEREWAEEVVSSLQGFGLEKNPLVRYILSPKNDGIPKAYNSLADLAQKEFLLLMDDDMYFLPSWDTRVLDTIEEGEQGVWRALTAIEPTGGTRWTIQGDFGRGPSSFNEDGLLGWVKGTSPSKPTMINHRPPNLVRKDEYLEIGGWSEEFFPGFCGDPDFAAKFHKKFCKKNPNKMRNVGDSLVYHFVSRTTNTKFGPKDRQEAHKVFKKKWGKKSSRYMDEVLDSGCFL